jgi:hypothetical protein
MFMPVRVLYSFIITWCIPSLFKFGDDINYTNSVLPIILYACVFISIGRTWNGFGKIKFKEKICYCIASFLFLACMSVGKMADTKGGLDLTDVRAIITPVIVMPYLAALIAKLYGLMDKLEPGLDNTTISRKEYMVYFVFMAACWGIVLLGVYPGFFVYDATDELMEVVTRQFTTHHPLFHVLYLGGIVQAGYKLFGSYNAGIFLFSIVQMLVFDVGILYVISKMSKFAFGRRFIRITVVYMGLFPIVPMIVLCSCKDSLFSLIMLVWIVRTYEFTASDDGKCDIVWIILTCLLCLVRNNAVYAIIASAFVMAAVFKKKRLKFAGMAVGSIVLYFAISTMLVNMLNAQSSGHQEMLTVPIQQIARTYTLEQDVFSSADKAALYEYLPEEYLEKYNPKLADQVKIGFVNEKYDEDKGGFWKIWVAGLKKAPVSYLNAWLMTSYGYWYPDTVVDVYRGNNVYTFTYDESSFFGYETEMPGTRQSLIPAIDSLYRKLSINVFKERVPLASILFSMGFVFWLFVFVVGYIIKTGGTYKALPYIMPLMVVATLLLGPTYLPRYVFFIWICLPFAAGNSMTTKLTEEINGKR